MVWGGVGNISTDPAIDPTDTTAPTITVARPYDILANRPEGRVYLRGLYATDDDGDPTTWVYVNVANAQSKTSCAASDFNLSIPYTEAGGLSFNPETDGNSKVCFRSTDANGNHGYGISDLIGNTGDTEIPRNNCPKWLVDYNSENGVDCCSAYQEADPSAFFYQDTDPSTDDTECVRMICEYLKKEETFLSELQADYWCST
ncbi:MAG: hypothetical protein OYG31_00960 [Candidatus Kaiserbacteria bacterium]|nr:hypothetical protein [Candidatus Kaiserbacteria bacterium]